MSDHQLDAMRYVMDIELKKKPKNAIATWTAIVVFVLMCPFVGVGFVCRSIAHAWEYGGYLADGIAHWLGDEL